MLVSHLAKRNYPHLKEIYWIIKSDNNITSSNHSSRFSRGCLPICKNAGQSPRSDGWDDDVLDLHENVKCCTVREKDTIECVVLFFWDMSDRSFFILKHKREVSSWVGQHRSNPQENSDPSFEINDLISKFKDLFVAALQSCLK